MTRDYDELQQAGMAARLEKLLQNTHKRGFDVVDLDYSRSRLEDERSELDDELDQLLSWNSYSLVQKILLLERVRSEAGDEGNFLDMIILTVDKMLIDLRREHAIEIR